MKVLLRSKATGHYFQGVGDWTPQVTNAFNFHRPERAVKFILGANLKVSEMEVVLSFPEPYFNICLPMNERFGLGNTAQTAFKL
jgi:hypothetical protein